MKAIPFFPQERPESCVPACVRMVLAACNISISEAEIYDCCQTDVDGTLPGAAAQCITAHNLDCHAIRLNGLAALSERLQVKNLFVILFANLAPLTGVPVVHAVVLDHLDESENEIHVLDPAAPPDGKRIWTFRQFELGWRAARYQTILISSPNL